jgi:hypothetical protein
MPGISYDDSGSLANYFGVTFLACALIPYTYAVFKPAKKGESVVRVNGRDKRLAGSLCMSEAKVVPCRGAGSLSLGRGTVLWEADVSLFG